MHILIVLVFFALVVGGIAWSIWAKAKRRKDLAAWAQLKGLRYMAGDIRVEHRWPEFACLRHGENRYAYNVMEGEWSGHPMTAFDYHYETHSHSSKGGRRTHHHHFSAVVLGSPVPLRPLSIRPENLFDKVAAVFGYDDIDFESAEFSKKFCVKAGDRKWAYDVLHARTIEFLLRMPQFQMEFGPHHVIAWTNRTFSILDFTAATEVVRGTLDRLPGYVAEQQTEEPRRRVIA